jgi:hypothetical protein
MTRRGLSLIRRGSNLDVMRLFLVVTFATSLVALVPADPLSASVAQGGIQGNSASKFAIETTKMTLNAQWGLVWNRLHPLHQKLVSREFWEGCQVESHDELPAGFKVTSLKAKAEYADRPGIPGVGPMNVRAVTLQMRFTVALLEGEQSVTDTRYWVKYGNTWRGFFAADTYAAYKKKHCPS